MERARSREEALFWTRFGLPVAVATLLSLALIGIGTWRAAARSDAISVERQERVAVRAILMSVATITREEQSNAQWDEAVRKSRPPYDPQWFSEYFGAYYQSQYGSAHAFTLDARDQAIYASMEGHTVAPSRFEEVRPAITRLIEEVRLRAPAHGDPRDQLVIDPAHAISKQTDGRDLPIIWAAHLELVSGRPAAVGVIRIVPATRHEFVPLGRESLLVVVRFLDRSFLKDLAKDHLIDHARFSLEPKLGEGEVSVLLRSPEGGTIGYFIWRPELPGTRLIADLAPLALVSAVLTVGIMGLLTLRLHTASRRIADDEARARHMAMHDPLTGLPNRALFADRLETACAFAARGKASALLLLDLDRFKQVNDTLGHAAGDGVLVQFARRILSLLRATDTVARFGGDEFGIVLSDVHSRETVEALCRLILAATARPFTLVEGAASVGVSIGVAILPDAGQTPEDVMRAADRALYAAKHSGRECYRLFDADPQAEMKAAA